MNKKKQYNLGGGLKDLGMGLLNAVATPLEVITGKNIVDPAYHTQMGKSLGKGLDAIQGLATGAAPTVANMLLPGSGAALAGLQNTAFAGVQDNSVYGNTLNSLAQGMGAAGSMMLPFMAMGGNLTEYKNGGTHEQSPFGGIPIGQDALVEQGETRNKDFIYSDRLKPKGSKKSFATLSKEIESKYKGRENDAAANKAKQQALDELAQQQESLKQESLEKEVANNTESFLNTSKRIMSNGGDIFQGIDVKALQNLILSRDANALSKFGVDGKLGSETESAANRLLTMQDLIDLGGTSDMLSTGIDIAPTTVDPMQDFLTSITPAPEPINISPENPIDLNTVDFTEQQLDAIKKGTAAASIPDVYNLIQAMKGPEETSLARVTPEIINLEEQRRQAKDQARMARNIARENIQGTMSGGQAFAGQLASDVAIESNLQDLIGQSFMSEENINAQILNQAKLTNTQITNQETLTNEQNKALVDSLISQSIAGLSNTAQSHFKDIAATQGQEAANQIILNALRTQDFGADKYGNITFKGGK